MDEDVEFSVAGHTAEEHAVSTCYTSKTRYTSKLYFFDMSAHYGV